MHNSRLFSTIRSYFPIILIAVVSCVSFTWFQQDSYLWGIDASLPLNINVSLKEYTYLLSSNVAFSAPDASKFAFLVPLGVIIQIISILKIPFSALIFQKVLIFILLFSSGASMYYLFSKLFPNSSTLAKLFSSFFYMFNFYSLSNFRPLAWIVFFYSFFPLIFALYFKGITQEKKYSYFIFLALVWTMLLSPSYMTPPYALISWFIIILFLIFHSSLLIPRWDLIRRLFISTLVLGIFWIIFSSFWIMPQLIFFKSEFIRRSVLQMNSQSLLVFNSSPMSNIFRSLGPAFLWDSYRGVSFMPYMQLYRLPLFIFIGFSIFITAFVSLFFKPKDKNIIFFSLLAIISIFFISGIYFPIKKISLFIFSHFSLDAIFRSLWMRFSAVISLSISVLLGFTLDKTAAFLEKKYFKFKSLLFLVAFIFFIFIFGFPFWTRQVYIQREGLLVSESMKIPDSYYKFAEWLENQNEDFEILPLPFLKTGIASLSWENGREGYIGTYPMLFLSNKSFIVSDFGNGIGVRYAEALFKGKIDNINILNTYNIKYLVFHKDANFKYMDGHNWYVSKVGIIENSLASIHDLIKIKTFGNILVYLNTRSKSQYIYLKPIKEPNKVDHLDSVKLSYKNINPTKKLVTIRNVSKPFSLVFSELYNQNWSIVPVYKSSKMELNKYISYIFPSKLYKADQTKEMNIFNSWYIDPIKFCNNHGHACKTNEDGSLDIYIYIEFIPQKLIFLCFLISVLSYLGVFIYLGLTIFFNNIKNAPKK